MVGLGILVAVALRAQAPLDDILRRLAEEAEVFARAARDVIAEETLTHRAVKGPARFRPRIGAAAMETPKLRFQSRQVVSEYAFGSFEDSPAVLHEFRQVVSVDGRKVVGSEKARRSLALGIRSRNDVVKRQMLKDFEKHGLTGAATDFGQLILLFVARRLAQFRFTLAGENRVGADAVVVISYQETGGRESLTVFEGRRTIHQALAGEIWARKPDWLPLRITARTRRPEGEHEIHSEVIVDYTPTAHGVVLPAAVTHRESARGQVLVENLFHYSPFRRFTAETELKFDIVERE